MDKTYEIKTVNDFLKVPIDRLDDCLSELKDYLDFVREIAPAIALMNEIGETKMDESFNWVDDGKRDKTVRLHDIETNEPIFHHLV